MTKKIGELLKAGNTNDPAKRFDLGKARWELIPDDALEKIVEIYSHGAIKYDEENWRKGMKWKRCIGSMKRHMKAFTTGEDIDPDSKCLHLGQIAWNAITLLWYQLEQIEGDDRVKTYKDKEYMILSKDDVERQSRMFWEKFQDDLQKEKEKQSE
jgi:hypothetical protein